MKHEIKQINREKNPPTHKGPYGEAWQIELAPDDKSPMVCVFIVFAPGAHPWWHYYTVACIHLRNIDGLPSPKILLDDATHEVWVMALDPSIPPNLNKPFENHLRPWNFAGQWKADARLNPVDLDEAAAIKVEDTVRDILSGDLNPDTDGVKGWIIRFSDSNIHK